MSSNQTLYYPIEKIKNTFTKVSITSFFKVAFPISNKGNTVGQGLLDRLVSTGVLNTSDAQGLDAIEHIELLCSNTILPGPAFKTSDTLGNRQGIVEKVPLYKQYPELAMTFYVDSNHAIIKFFEGWTNYINPLYGNSGVELIPNNLGQNGNEALYENDYYRLRYPNEYTQNILVTKFERDMNSVYTSGNRIGVKQSNQLTYNFIQAYPNNIIAYTVTFNYSRYVLQSTPENNGKTVLINDATTQKDWIDPDIYNPEVRPV
jgi:hypothetical protein